MMCWRVTLGSRRFDCGMRRDVIICSRFTSISSILWFASCCGLMAQLWILTVLPASDFGVSVAGEVVEELEELSGVKIWGACKDLIGAGATKGNWLMTTEGEKVKERGLP